MYANELSFIPPAKDVAIAQSQVEQFIMTIKAAKSRGAELRLPEDFFAMPLAGAYYWKDWFSDKRIDIEKRRYFETVSTKYPFFKDDPKSESAWGSVDCFWEGKSAQGLKAAYIADGLAISMASSREWDSHFISVEIQEIVENDVSCRKEDVHHASSAKHVDTQVDWIQQRIKSSINTGDKLWKHVKDFFPCLNFCKHIQKQMDGMPTESMPSLIRGLFRLNDYCVSWKHGAFNHADIGCAVSPESAPTMKKFEAERTFLCPDGKKRVFRWHAKVGQWRIYFEPASEPGHLLIGYVGKHLRTVKYR